MAPKSLSYIHSLTPEKIQAVIDDITLIQKGYQLFYAIDPHEIFDFCFPINPLKDFGGDIDSIADDQAALYYVFFGRKNRPLLLPDYVGEMRGLLMRFNEDMEEAFDLQWSTHSSGKVS